MSGANRAFITIEGIEGGGKTTQVSRLAASIEATRRTVRVTREPGGTPLGAAVRELLLHSDLEVGPFSELFLILADRAEHVRSVIQPALARGEVVLCDRFSDSTLAYQAYGRGLPLAEVRAAESAARQGLRPDLTIVLDCPVSVGLARTVRRRGQASADRFESERGEFHERVRQGFLALAGEDPARIVVVDGSGDPDAVHAAVRRIVAERLSIAIS